jgi:hypothetical protein
VYVWLGVFVTISSMLLNIFRMKKSVPSSFSFSLRVLSKLTGSYISLVITVEAIRSSCFFNIEKPDQEKKIPLVKIKADLSLSLDHLYSTRFLSPDWITRKIAVACPCSFTRDVYTRNQRRREKQSIARRRGLRETGVLCLEDNTHCSSCT